MLSKPRFRFPVAFIIGFVLFAAPLAAAPKEESSKKEDISARSTSDKKTDGDMVPWSIQGGRSTSDEKTTEPKIKSKSSNEKERQTAKPNRKGEKSKVKANKKSTKKKGDNNTKSTRESKKSGVKTDNKTSKTKEEKDVKSPRDSKKNKVKTKSKPSTKRSLEPISEKKAISSHAPFESGDCNVCHKTNNKKDPGPVTTASSELCYTCHEEFSSIMAKPHLHPPAEQSCVNCHNPHNSYHAKLLFDDRSALCLDCHKPVKQLLAKAKIQHGAVTSGSKCAGCHNSHASDVEHLLIQLPFDLCVNCHSKDDMVDSKGKKLTNFKKLLAKNPVHHAPVASKDCSACHMPHGSYYFRLLKAKYPAKFYSAYDPKNYKLCFECHNDKVAATARTTTLTNFRDGDNNLHFFHINRVDRGRTCRACHEVHASKQPHQIRDTVPYGTKGWKLKVKFTSLPNGGACEKTCHSRRVYTAKEPGDEHKNKETKRVAKKKK